MKALVAAILVLAILAQPALATTINVETKILSDTSTRTALSFRLEGPAAKEIAIPIFYNIEKVSTDANFPMVCKTEKRPYGSDVVCDVSALGSRSGSFKVEYETRDLVIRAGESRLFKQQIVVPIDASKVQFRVVLPDGTGLVGDKAYLPEDGFNATDGRRIYVSWTQESVKKGDILSSQITYQYFFPDIGLLGIALPVVAILAIIAYMVTRRQPVSQKVEPIKYILPILKEDEKLVMEKILAAGSPVHQKHVVKETGYSKGKVSKVLASLEDRGMVRLERIGRSNKIYLQDKMEKTPQKASVNNQTAENSLNNLESTTRNNPEEL